MGSSQIGGLRPPDVLRDLQKLAALLTAAEHHHPGRPVPATFVAVLDNHPTRRLDIRRLKA